MLQADYARMAYAYAAHHTRFKRYVESRPRKLVCQECHGDGGEVEPVLDYGEGPWVDCGWCEGTGLVSGYIRALWLIEKRKEKQRRRRMEGRVDGTR